MCRIRVRLGLTLLVAVLACHLYSQQAATVSGNVTVPRLVNFTGVATDLDGKPLTGTVGITFSLYQDSQGGASLWLETQNAQADRTGHYSVQLGATKAHGLPLELFSSGEARWLGVSINGGPEQPRVLLLSVPYALKAGDAETIGGLPPSAFALASGSTGASSLVPGPSASSSPSSAPTPSGTLDFIPLFTDNSGGLGNSALFQTGTGTTAKIGINTTTPASVLDVKGASTMRGTLNLPATGTATAAVGKNSQPQQFVASAFNSGTAAAVNQIFRWQAEPAGNNTAAPSGILSLLYGSGSSTPTETGLNIAGNGKITFASGQTFPGTGTITGVTTGNGSGLMGGGASGALNLSLTNACASGQLLQWDGSAWACSSAGSGSITAVNAGTDLVGGGNSGSVTLNLDTTKVAQLNSANSFAGNQSISGSLSVTGSGATTTGTFVGNNTTQIGLVTQNGTGSGLLVQQNDTGTGADYGIFATSSGQHGTAIVAQATNSASGASGLAVVGTAFGPVGVGVYGSASNVNGGTGVVGYAASGAGGIGVNAVATSATGIAAVMDNTGGGKVLSARHNGVEVLNVDGSGNLQANGNITTQGGQAIIRSGAVPGVFNNTAGGTILIGQNNGTQKFSFDGAGNLATTGAVTAASFSGNGSGLTGIPELSTSNTFIGNQTIAGTLNIGTGISTVSTQMSGKDAGGGGIQNVAANTSTSGNSFAVFAATSSAGVTTEMVADGLGTGAMRTVGGYLGTYTNQPMGFITNNTERVHIDTLGNVGIGTQVPAARLESDAPSNSGAAAISARGGSTSNSLNGGGGIVATGGLNNSSVGQGGTGVLATGGLETYPDQNFSTNGGTGIVGNGGQAFGDNSVGGDGGSFSGGNSPGIGGDGVVASGGTGATTGRAGYFVGWVEIQKDLYVDGSIFATNKDFRIDHPLAPADKYLYHASVESSEMMDIYTGNVMTSSQGEAMVVLPGWFEALNGDFRYQLTVIGQFAQAIIAKEISNNRFTIKTDKPNVRVSWQVTAVRHDAAALAHPLQVEVDKSARERGYYIHPDLYGAPEEKGIGWAGNPQLMKRIKADREKR